MFAALTSSDNFNIEVTKMSTVSVKNGSSLTILGIVLCVTAVVTGALIAVWPMVAMAAIGAWSFLVAGAWYRISQRTPIWFVSTAFNAVVGVIVFYKWTDACGFVAGLAVALAIAGGVLMAFSLRRR